MSSEWAEARLADLGSFDRGKSKHRPRDAAHLYGGQYPFIQTGDIAASGGRITSFRQTYSEAGLAQSKLWPANTLCITIAANIAETALLTFPACFPDSVVGYTPYPNKADVRFIEYLFRAFRDNVKRRAYGSVQENINLDVLRNLVFPVPPLETQKRIADVLTLFDDRITLLRETNATLEAIAQALFKSWFVDFDPVLAKAEGRQPEGMDAATSALFPDSFDESELGDIPVGWGVRPIGEMVEGIYDGPHATPPEADEGPVFLGIKNLTGTSLDLSEIRHISESDWGQWTRRVEPRCGDIVFSYEATLGFFALIPPDVRCCLGRRLALVRPHVENGAGLFWFHQFISKPFQQLLDKHTIHGATVNRIALKAFPSYSVLNPPQAVKLAFDALVSPLWATIHKNQAQAQTLTQLRDTLLPRLISGQLRLPEAESLVEETAGA